MSEKEYIERGALIAFVREARKKLPKDSKDFFTRDEMLLNFQQYLELQKAADVEPVVRGEWKEIRDPYGDLTGWIHEECGMETNFASEYCSKCGAKMTFVERSGADWKGRCGVLIAYMRGHEIQSHNGRNWFYSDDGSVADDSRPCKRCGRKPTPEGYDACMGHVDGAISVCCGHGVEEPILMMEGDNGE